MIEWLGLLVTEEKEIKSNKYQIDEEKYDFLSKIVEYIFSIDLDKRKLSHIAHAFKLINLEERLSIWHSQGMYAYLFDNEIDEFNNSELVYSFDFTSLVKNNEDNIEAVIPMLSYILHRFTNSLDGLPAMLVLDEAWRILDNSVFAFKLSDLMQELIAKNVVTIFATESIQNATNSKITSTIMDHITTAIYLPNLDADNSYRTIFRLTKQEFKILSTLDMRSRQFLIKHKVNNQYEAVVGELDLSRIMDVISVLSSDDTSREILKRVIDRVQNEDPEIWFEIMMNVIRDMYEVDIEKIEATEEEDYIIDFDEYDYKNQALEKQQQAMLENIEVIKQKELYSEYQTEEK